MEILSHHGPSFDKGKPFYQIPRCNQQMDQIHGSWTNQILTLETPRLDVEAGKFFSAVYSAQISMFQKNKVFQSNVFVCLITYLNNTYMLNLEYENNCMVVPKIKHRHEWSPRKRHTMIKLDEILDIWATRQSIAQNFPFRAWGFLHKWHSMEYLSVSTMCVYNYFSMLIYKYHAT